MLRLFWALSVCLLAACATDEAIREQSLIGERGGQAIYRIETDVKVHRNMETARDKQIATQGARLCPGGFQELARSEPRVWTNAYSYPVTGTGVWIRRAEPWSKVDTEITCSG